MGGTGLATSFIEHTLYNTNLTSLPIRSNHYALMFRHFTQHRDYTVFNTGIQTGLQYIQKGWKQSFQQIAPLTTRLNYLVLPMESVVYMGNEKNRLSLVMGMYAEYLLSYELPQAPDMASITYEDFFTFDPQKDKRTGYGLSVGLGFQRDFSFGAILIEGKATYSISNFISIDSVAGFTPDISNLINGVISIGYLIPLH